MVGSVKKNFFKFQFYSCLGNMLNEHVINDITISDQQQQNSATFTYVTRINVTLILNIPNFSEET